MSTIHLRQIRAHLETHFRPLVDMSDLANRSPQERENVFLSRSLAAFSLVHLTNVDPQEAVAALTDQGQDNGIDAALYHIPERSLYLVQSKWRHDGSGTISRGDVQKFLTGFRDLVNARFDRFNEKMVAKKATIEAALNDARTRIVLVIAYTGQQPLSEEVTRDIRDLLDEMNDPSEVVAHHVLRQGSLYAAVSAGSRGTPINLDVQLYDWGQVREPFLAYYGQVSASDVAQWWKDHYPRLFSPNIRMFLGETDVNESLLGTLQIAPENFWYFNNGITGLCARIQKKPIGGTTRDTGVFECHDLRIVNGAQTAGAIASAAETHSESVSKARVPIRIISLEQCPEGFDREITRSNNTQNRIERRDFVALDPEQERIRNELMLEGVQYVYKSGDAVTSTEKGFDLVEATVARACAERDIALSVQAKREIGRLWEDIEKPPYKTLFNPSVSSLELWFSVQVLRRVESNLEHLRNSREGRERLLAVHGNRFLTHVVFQTLPAPSSHTASALDSAFTQAIKHNTDAAYTKTLEIINTLYPEAYLANLFKNLVKCKQILSSEELLRRKVRDELVEDAKTYGNQRRSPTVERKAAKAMDESVLIPTDPVTVVLSEKGCVLQAKGHEIDPRELSYKTGDSFLQAANGRSDQFAVFLDSTGRAYSAPAHSLPSAEEQGESLSNRFAPPPGASFVGVMIGPAEDLYVLASEAGYGFVAKLGDLHGRNRAGKAVLNVAGSRPLMPQKVNNLDTDLLAAATNEGRLLIFPLNDLPVLPKGKGVKIMSIKGERLVGVTPLPPNDRLIVRAGQRYLNLKPSEWAEFTGNRALRGNKLPRGFQNVVGLEVG
jgi:hypothetical protein